MYKIVLLLLIGTAAVLVSIFIYYWFINFSLYLLFLSTFSRLDPLTRQKLKWYVSKKIPSIFFILKYFSEQILIQATKDISFYEWFEQGKKFFYKAVQEGRVFYDKAVEVLKDSSKEFFDLSKDQSNKFQNYLTTFLSDFQVFLQHFRERFEKISKETQITGATQTW